MYSILKNPQGGGKGQILTFTQIFVIAVACQKSSKLPVILLNVSFNYCNMKKTFVQIESDYMV